MTNSEVLLLAGENVSFLDFIGAQKLSFLDYESAHYTNEAQREKHVSIFSKMLSRLGATPSDTTPHQPVSQAAEKMETPVPQAVAPKEDVAPQKQEIRPVNLDYLQFSIDKIRKTPGVPMETKTTMVLNLLYLSSEAAKNVEFARNLVANTIPVDKRNMMLLNMVTMINQKAKK